MTPATAIVQREVSNEAACNHPRLAAGRLLRPHGQPLSAPDQTMESRLVAAPATLSLPIFSTKRSSGPSDVYSSCLVEVEVTTPNDQQAANGRVDL